MLVVIHLVPVHQAVHRANQPGEPFVQRVDLPADGRSGTYRRIHQNGVRGDKDSFTPDGEDIAVRKDPVPFRPPERGPVPLPLDMVVDESEDGIRVAVHDDVRASLQSLVDVLPACLAPQALPQFDRRYRQVKKEREHRFATEGVAFEGDRGVIGAAIHGDQWRVAQQGQHAVGFIGPPDLEGRKRENAARNRKHLEQTRSFSDEVSITLASIRDKGSESSPSLDVPSAACNLPCLEKCDVVSFISPSSRRAHRSAEGGKWKDC